MAEVRKDKRLKTVIITTKLPEDIWLINVVSQVCDIVGIVFPKGKRYREYGVAQVLRKRLFRLGPVVLIDQALLVLYRYIFERSQDDRALKRIFQGHSLSQLSSPGVDILEVEDVNSAAVGNFIRQRTPDIVVVSGAPLLKKRIIDAAEGKMINLHPGYAPEYRGRYGAYWPVYNKEPQLVGVTVHFVDTGIDTGRILLRQKIHFDINDTVKTITYKQHIAGVALIERCLTNFDEIAERACRITGSPSKNYRAMGLSHYLKAKKWFRRKVPKTKVG